MPKLSEILEHTAELDVPIAGTTVKVSYRPSVYTSAFLSGLGEMSATEALEKLIVSWDLTDDAGKPVPIKSARLEQLPLILLHAVSDAISEALLPNVGMRRRSGSAS